MKNGILVVDDSIIVRQQITHSLTHAGYEVLEAADGKEGLRQAESAQGLRLIICDVNMPVLNGIGMLAGLKEKGLLARVDVLMLTSEVDPELITRAKSLGAKGWIVKPVSMEALVATVKKLLA